jgi:hypothetical protein
MIDDDYYYYDDDDDDDDDDECGAVGAMRIVSGNRSTRRKPISMPLCPPQSQRDLTWARTQTAAVENWQLTA